MARPCLPVPVWDTQHHPQLTPAVLRRNSPQQSITASRATLFPVSQTTLFDEVLDGPRRQRSLRVLACSPRLQRHMRSRFRN